MAFGSVFTPDPRSPLALLHSPYMVLWIHELISDVNELDGESACGTCDRDFRPILV